ncbi:YqaJ-like viral recombinase domain [Metamycoplasma arthritidis]|uniref:YqaJ viral recombinase domain-containing protein n=1 Tax=Metamycoplasma arthritidis (strain 158L3-1) TaxID=243272 RepID=B3PME7_META1|nr:YqaJ viral recombinase family protein [Metamycoplasma arthritidis]ACF07199.1 conserved hypothetical protein [Metamycoplasma arthritidis 158L3-1]VEU78723.1 YqaJ-like viral recombinase domain [Metamycoplasma arthritidis]
MFEAPNRKYYNDVDYTINFENKTIILNADFHKKLLANKVGSFSGFKKITGSAIADILEVDSFKSQFAAFARLCGLQLPVLDRKYVDAGIIIEPKILEMVEKALKEPLERFPAEKYNYDYFKDNPLFGGLPDGYAKNRKMIVEIKTTNIKNYENWLAGFVPLGYLKQAQLYSYLMGVDIFSIVAIFLEAEDYKNPELVPIKKRHVKNFDYKVDVAQVEDDIKFCEAWFKKYTTLGISPQWKNNIDNDLIEYLKCRNIGEWTTLYNKWVEIGKAVVKNEDS